MFGGCNQKKLKGGYILKVQPIGQVEYKRLKEIKGDSKAIVSIIGRVELPLTDQKDDDGMDPSQERVRNVVWTSYV